MVANVVEVVALTECSCCEVVTVANEIDEATGECAACTFAGWVASHEAWLAEAVGDDVREVA